MKKMIIHSIQEYEKWIGEKEKQMDTKIYFDELK
jgi:hypothetical protein